MNLDDLKLEWKQFKYFQIIENDELTQYWKCLNGYKSKVLDKTLKLSEYTNRVNSVERECSYLCQFLERDSSKYFAAAKPGNANNYGIKMNNDGTYYCSKKITDNKELFSVNENEANKFFPIILDNLYKIFEEPITDENIKEKSKIFDKLILPGKLVLKMVAMNNNGKFLYTYKTEVLRSIYTFLYKKESRELTDFELSYFVTKKAKEIFNNFINEKEDIYLIKLSSFLWQKFQEEDKQINEIQKDKGSNRMKQPLNQILYGSPGTGKTYNTINKALEIIFQDSLTKEDYENGKVKEERLVELSQNELSEEEKKDIANDSRKLLKACFEKYKNAGQIEFVTFHQSYGYEEFVEGIKAETNDESIIYKTKSGIFKALCEKANDKEFVIDNISINENSSIWKISLGSTYENKIKTKCFNDDEIRIGWTDVEKIGDENFNKLGINNQSTIRNFIDDMEIGDLVISIYNQNKIDGIGIIESEYKSDDDEHYNKFRKVKWLSKDILDLTQLNGNKVFVQKTVYKIDRFKPKDLLSLIKQNELQVRSDNTNKNYILIIDEINRGNISKIFGELITLIEDSKRLDKLEQVEITLPYSGKKFGVPQNLYIIGTMNTADRSIALMDTALRRRFYFEEMMPTPDLLKDEKGNDLMVYDINIKSLLETINKRIEYLYDRDHTIGHAYFMSLNGIEKEEDKKAELDNIFRNKIIPLLQEYFYDDWEKIQIVLGDHINQFNSTKKENQINFYYENEAKESINKYRFVQSIQFKEIDVIGFNHEDIEDEQINYKVSDKFEIECYKKIYYKESYTEINEKIKPSSNNGNNVQKSDEEGQ